MSKFPTESFLEEDEISPLSPLTILAEGKAPVSVKSDSDLADLMGVYQRKCRRFFEECQTHLCLAPDEGKPLTQRELATAIGITQKKLSQAITGVALPTVRLLNIFTFAQEVGVPFTMNPTDDEKLYEPADILGGVAEVRRHYVQQLNELRRGKTQTEFGDLLGVTQTTVSNILSPEPKKGRGQLHNLAMLIRVWDFAHKRNVPFDLDPVRKSTHQ